MRRIFPLGLALLIIAHTAFAQDAGATVNRARQKGLLFTLAGLDNFGVSGNLLRVAVPSGTASSQNLAGRGFKYYLSTRMAVRGALHFGLVQTDTQTTAGTSTTKVTTIGFAPGVEFFLAENVSLGAEYQLGANFTSGKTEIGPTSRDLPKTLRLGISALAATLAINR